MQRISGPFDGFYIATYTTQSPLGHLAFSKACTQRPAHVWDGTPGVVKVMAGPCDSEVVAILFGVDKALSAINE